ncbi:hypothetical protein QBC41DRAFT_280104 [Cercophora samala]|uniref:Uncharacterized protein n=1 Tax=Cercophora samala TaxID=330535 RepID=A0AA40DAX3_9PEZI|nr:hypothetical protein QBC41DRAFT_280104 [Cercophora samala]
MSGASPPNHEFSESDPVTWVPGDESLLERDILNRIRNHDNSPRTTVEFRIDFDHDQYNKSHKEGDGTDLDWAYALIGFRDIVQAATTFHYMAYTWPQTGARLHRALDSCLRQRRVEDRGIPIDVSFPTLAGLELEVGLETRTTPQGAQIFHLAARLVGQPGHIASVGSQLGWFCGAFRKSPQNNLLYCQPMISNAFRWLDKDYAANPSLPVMTITIHHVDIFYDRFHPDGPRACWNGLFLDRPHARVVSGYPIRVQPGYTLNTQPVVGLEITWKILTRIGNCEMPVRRPLDLARTPIVVYGEWFFLISKVLTRGWVFWHLERRYGSDGSEFRVDDLPRPMVSNGFDFDQMEGYRHFIGGECGRRRRFTVEGLWYEGFSCPE